MIVRISGLKLFQEEFGARVLAGRTLHTALGVKPNRKTTTAFPSLRRVVRFLYCIYLLDSNPDSLSVFHAKLPAFQPFKGFEGLHGCADGAPSFPSSRAVIHQVRHGVT